MIVKFVVKIAKILLLGTLVLSGCKTLEAEQETLPFTRLQVKEAAFHALNTYDYSVNSSTKTRISADRSGYYNPHTNFGPNVDILLHAVDDQNTTVTIEFKRPKDFSGLSDDNTHARMLAVMKKFLIKKHSQSPDQTLKETK